MEAVGLVREAFGLSDPTDERHRVRVFAPTRCACSGPKYSLVRHAGTAFSIAYEVNETGAWTVSSLG